MQDTSLMFELTVAVLLILAGSYLHQYGMPGSALVVTGVVLGAITFISRGMSVRQGPHAVTNTRARNTDRNPG